jgi:ribokinase
MGAAVTMIGCVGQDGFGEELRASAARDGIDVQYVYVDEKTATGIALITVDDLGQNTIVVASGANLALTPERLLASKQAFATADVLVAQLESPLETVSEALSLAAENRLKVVLNPAPARPLSAEFLSKVDYFIPNEREAMQVVGAETLEAAINQLLGMGVRNLIITLGEKGVLVVTADGRKQIPSYPVKAVDTVAAGDAFVGAFATGISEGLNIDDAVKFGNAAAAISVTRHGAQPSLPLRKEVNEFLAGQSSV